MIEYLVDEAQYSFRYKDLRDKYREILHMSDEEFVEKIPEILYTACFIIWIKEYGQWAVSDVGIVHRLAQLLHIHDLYGEDKLRLVHEIREQFKEQCDLA